MHASDSRVRSQRVRPQSREYTRTLMDEQDARLPPRHTRSSRLLLIGLFRRGGLAFKRRVREQPPGSDESLAFLGGHDEGRHRDAADNVVASVYRLAGVLDLGQTEGRVGGVLDRLRADDRGLKQRQTDDKSEGPIRRQNDRRGSESEVVCRERFLNLVVAKVSEEGEKGGQSQRWPTFDLTRRRRGWGTHLQNPALQLCTVLDSIVAIDASCLWKVRVVVWHATAAVKPRGTVQAAHMVALFRQLDLARPLLLLLPICGGASSDHLDDCPLPLGNEEVKQRVQDERVDLDREGGDGGRAQGQVGESEGGRASSVGEERKEGLGVMEGREVEAACRRTRCIQDVRLPSNGQEERSLRRRRTVDQGPRIDCSGRGARRLSRVSTDVER